MGILKSGILGPFRNKVGPAIGRRHRGQNVLSALPHTSNKPFNADQLESQSKFGLLSSFLSDIDLLINTGFKAFTKRNSPVNEAFSYNYDHAFVKEGDGFVIDYPKIVYSRGHIVTPESPQIFLEPESITINWLPQNQSAYCQFTDMASFLVYNPAKKLSAIFLNRTNRYAQGYTMNMPKDFIGDTVHCYMNFNSGNGKKTGDSMYVAEVIVI